MFIYFTVTSLLGNSNYDRMLSQLARRSEERRVDTIT